MAKRRLVINGKKYETGGRVTNSSNRRNIPRPSINPQPKPKPSKRPKIKIVGTIPPQPYLDQCDTDPACGGATPCLVCTGEPTPGFVNNGPPCYCSPRPGGLLDTGHTGEGGPNCGATHKVCGGYNNTQCIVVNTPGCSTCSTDVDCGWVDMEEGDDTTPPPGLEGDALRSWCDNAPHCHLNQPCSQWTGNSWDYSMVNCAGGLELCTAHQIGRCDCCTYGSGYDASDTCNQCSDGAGCGTCHSCYGVEGYNTFDCDDVWYTGPDEPQDSLGKNMLEWPMGACCLGKGRCQKYHYCTEAGVDFDVDGAAACAANSDM